MSDTHVHRGLKISSDKDALDSIVELKASDLLKLDAMKIAYRVVPKKVVRPIGGKITPRRLLESELLILGGLKHELRERKDSGWWTTTPKLQVIMPVDSWVVEPMDQLRTVKVFLNQQQLVTEKTMLKAKRSKKAASKTTSKSKKMKGLKAL